MTTIDVVMARAWINLARDPAQGVSVARTVGSASTAVDGEVRQYAGGRTRVITRPGTVATGKLSFRTTDHTIPATLRKWAGEIVCVRDELGRRSFASYFEVPETDLGMGWIDVDLTFQAVTYTEAV